MMRLSSLPVTVGLVLALLLTIHVLPRLTSVLLLVFAGIILAVVLNALTTTLRRVLPGGHVVAYSAALVCVALALSVIGLLIGPQLATEVPQLIEQMPKAWHTLLAHLNNYAFFDSIASEAHQPFNWLVNNAQLLNLVSSTFGMLFNFFIVIFVGVYGAAAPARYLHFGDRLLTASQQERVGELAHDLGRGLRHWLLARAVSMIVVGVATGVGLWLLGVDLAFTLGFWAGMASFVPYIGPVLGLIPAVLIAALESLQLAVWVLLLFAAVQFVETAFMTPLIQQKAIALPPVVLIAVQLIGGVLIGPIGVLLAAPLVVCGMIGVGWHRAGERAQSSVE